MINLNKLFVVINQYTCKFNKWPHNSIICKNATSQYILLSIIVLSGKIELKNSIDVLIATKPKLEKLIMDLVLLKSKTLEIANSLLHEDFSAFIDRIALLTKDARHLLAHLMSLQKEFDCKFKQVCYDDDLKIAMNTLLQKITKIGDVEHHCKRMFPAYRLPILCSSMLFSVHLFNISLCCFDINRKLLIVFDEKGTFTFIFTDESVFDYSYQMHN